MNKILTPNDYLKKEPSKNEKMWYEMVLKIQQLERLIAYLQKQLLSVGRIAGIKAEDLAQSFHDDKSTEEYFKAVGDAERKIVEAKVKEEQEKLEKLKKLNPNDDANSTPTA